MYQYNNNIGYSINMLCTSAISYMLQYYMHMEIKQNKRKEKQK